MNKIKGQVAVEYVLLLLIVVSIALIMVQFVEVGQQSDPASAGALIQYWRKLLEAIGLDEPLKLMFPFKSV